MFTGIDFEKAIDYYRKGKEVIVLDRASVGKNGKSGYDTFPFEELFKDLDFLVDVPAVINPDFEQAVQGMTEADQVDPEEIIRAGACLVERAVVFSLWARYRDRTSGS